MLYKPLNYKINILPQELCWQYIPASAFLAILHFQHPKNRERIIKILQKRHLFEYSLEA